MMSKAPSSHYNGMPNRNGPVRAMDMNYDNPIGGGYQNMKSSNTTGYSNYGGKQDNYNEMSSKQSTTAYSNSNYRKPFNPNNM